VRLKEGRKKNSHILARKKKGLGGRGEKTSDAVRMRQRSIQGKESGVGVASGRRTRSSKENFGGRGSRGKAGGRQF